MHFLANIFCTLSYESKCDYSLATFRSENLILTYFNPSIPYTARVFWYFTNTLKFLKYISLSSATLCEYVIELLLLQLASFLVEADRIRNGGKGGWES
jgi:hypothetical protein